MLIKNKGSVIPKIKWYKQKKRNRIEKMSFLKSVVATEKFLIVLKVI